MSRMWPNENYLRSSKPEPFLSKDERTFYQSELEQLFPNYEFSKLDDHRIMDIYDTEQEHRQGIIDEYYKKTWDGLDDPNRLG